MTMPILYPPASHRSRSPTSRRRLTENIIYSSRVNTRSVDCENNTNEIVRAVIDELPNWQDLIQELREAVGRWLHVHGLYITDLADALNVAYDVLYRLLRGVVVRGPAPATYASMRDRERFLPQPWDDRTMKALQALCDYHRV